MILSKCFQYYPCQYPYRFSQLNPFTVYSPPTQVPSVLYVPHQTKLSFNIKIKMANKVLFFKNSWKNKRTESKDSVLTKYEKVSQSTLLKEPCHHENRRSMFFHLDSVLTRSILRPQKNNFLLLLNSFN